MTDEVRTNGRPSSSDGSTGAAVADSKLPYHRPAFRHEGVFETMARSCGKIDSTQKQCKSNRKAF
jgi:hypothetical protein